MTNNCTAPTKIDSDGRSGSNEILAVAVLAGSLLLYLAVGDWPSTFYSFSHLAIFLLSLAIANFAWKIDEKGWLAFAIVGATIYNPILPVGFRRDEWEIASLVYAVSYGLFGIGQFRPRTARIATWIFAALAATALALTFFVNRTMPHGPKYYSDEVICTHEGGDCGEALVEDMSQLDIPDWAKFLRSHMIWTWFFLVGGTVLCHARSTQKK